MYYGIGHNPILPTDITALPSGTTIVDYINGLVDLSKNTSNGLNLSAYVGTQQCIIDVVTRNGASSMIYVYLNFKSKEAAAQYLKDMSNDTDGSEVVTKAIKRTWKHYFTCKHGNSWKCRNFFKCIICEFVIIKYCFTVS